MKNSCSSRQAVALFATVAAAIISGAGARLLGVCGPFTDVSDAAFCPFVLEIFTLGVTTGTTPTTYDPGASVTRLQMAAFLSRTVDRVLQRESPRAALNRFATTQNAAALGVTTLGTGNFPSLAKSDGTDVWVTAAVTNGAVLRVRGSDGRLLETWTGAGAANDVLAAMGRIFVTGGTSPGRLYRIDPSQAAGAVTTVATNLGNGSQGIAFDGARLWTADPFGPSVSIVTPTAVLPFTVTTVTAGFSTPVGVLFDGANIWVRNAATPTLVKLNSSGAVLQTVTVGGGASLPGYDGANIWVPNPGVPDSDTVSVVRASTGALLATLTGNGLSLPAQAAFDGERVLVTNSNGNSVSLWKAADLTPIGSFSTGPATSPYGACSDGVSFWIMLSTTNAIARF